MVERSPSSLAVVEANRLLVEALGSLVKAHQLKHLPVPLVAAITQLSVDVARVQGLSEWVSEGLADLSG